MVNLEHSHTHSEDHHLHNPKNVFQNIVQKVWDNRVIILLLIAIFLIAFGIRGHLLRYEYLFEFDAFYHARIVEDLVKQGFVSNPDPLAYYQQGGALAAPVSLYHVTSTILYKIISFGQPFNKDFFMWSIQFFPVFFGALICLIIYFLGKEVFNSKKIGLITAFIAAVTPAFAYRTMAGAQGDNAFGFLWMVIGFVFFIRAVKTNGLKRNDLINASLGGIFFGMMAMSWSMYLLIPLIVIAYSLFAVVLIASRETHEHHDHKNLLENHALIFSIKVLISMVIFHIITYAYGEDWIKDALGYVGSAINLDSTIILLLVLIAAVIAIVASVFFISKMSNENKKMFSILAILALYAGFFIIIFMFITVPDLMQRTTVASLVGEESVGNQFFGTKYNVLILFPYIALLLCPLGLWFFKKHDSHTQLLLFFWVLLTLFMAWYKLKFTFVFGLAIAPAAAIVAHLIFEGLKKFTTQKGIETKIIYVCLFAIILLGVGASARFFPDYVPYTDQHKEWTDAMSWIENNTPTDAKLFNWWDQGHILAFLTERKVSADNRNYGGRADLNKLSGNQYFATFATTTDTNKAYEIASKGVGADYIILSSDMIGSMASFEFYANNSVDQKYVQKYSGGVTRIIPCVDNNTTVTCSGNSIPRQQWNLMASNWKSTPDDFYNGTDPIYYYRSTDELLILNSAENKSNLVKVWTNSEETKNYYKEVYYSQGIKIFQIIK